MAETHVSSDTPRQRVFLTLGVGPGRGRGPMWVESVYVTVRVRTCGERLWKGFEVLNVHTQSTSY